VPRSDADPNKMGHYRRAQLDSIDLLHFRQTQVLERVSDSLSSVCVSLCLGLSLCMCVCMCVRVVSHRLCCSDVGNVTGHVYRRCHGGSTSTSTSSVTARQDGSGEYL